MHSIRARRWVTALLVAILVAAASGYIYNLTPFRTSEDEGQYLYDAWRISLGDVPYRDFVTAQMPAFLYLGGLLQRVFGPARVPLRAISVVSVLLAGGLAFFIAMQMFGPSVALLAIIAFLANDRVYAIGRIWRSDPYMLLGSTLGLALFTWSVAQQDSRHRERGLVLAGLAYALATLFKLLGLLAAGGCLIYFGWTAYTRHSFSSVRRDLGVFSAAFLLPLLLTASLFTAIQPDFLAQVVGHHLRQGHNVSFSTVLVERAHLLTDFAHYQPLFLVLAGVGIILLIRQSHPAARALLTQLPTALALLLIKRGAESRYLVYLAPAVSICWATGLVKALQWTVKRGRRRPVWNIAILLVLLLGGWSLKPHLERDIATVHKHTQWNAPAADFLRLHTKPGEVIVSDEQWLNFLARRPSTRTAAAISEGAAGSGQITGQILKREIEATTASAVVLNFGAAGRQLLAMSDFDAFYRFVQSSFALVRVFGQGEDALEVYLRKDILPSHPHVRFGKHLMLTGADLGATRLPADVARHVLLRWQALSPIGKDLSYSLRVVDEAGELWAQVDGPVHALRFREGIGGKPFNASLPTSAWASGQVALTTSKLSLPPGIPPGVYQLRVRVYGTKDLIPLPVTDPSGRPLELDAPIGPVEVMPAHMPAIPEKFSIAHPMEAQWPGLRMLGYGPLRERAHPGDSATIDLYWQAIGISRPRYQLHIISTNATGKSLAQSKEVLGGTAYPVSQWRSGEVIHTKHRLTIPRESTGPLTIFIQLQDRDGQPVGAPIHLTDIEVLGHPRVFEPPSNISHRLDARFGTIARLAGYTLTYDRRAVRLVLAWQALGTTSHSYKVFVHLIDANDTIVAQRDSVPAGGSAPTTSWLPGEVITDEYTLETPPNLPPGEYRLRVGLYDDSTLRRLPVTGMSTKNTQDYLILGETIQIVGPREGENRR
ncbi:MAG: phospholipid carrier-dependent glycosyltransferase [Anaerolineae bacterium]|nr:phospholipid carrier-dependent glycosyltransferase [Anaerolineae bacterium]